MVSSPALTWTGVACARTAPSIGFLRMTSSTTRCQLVVSSFASGVGAAGGEGAGAGADTGIGAGVGRGAGAALAAGTAVGPAGREAGAVGRGAGAGAAFSDRKLSCTAAAGCEAGTYWARRA